jgi:Fe-S cluster assembly protein SufD
MSSSVPSVPGSQALRSFEAQWRARSVDSLAPVREQAMQRFLQLGLPSLRDESWRYTDLRSVAGQSFAETADDALPAQTSTPSWLDASDSLRIVMTNGRTAWDTELALIDGLEISHIRDVSKANPKSITPFMESLSDADQRRFVLLNTALFIDGLYLKISKPLAKPLVIVHVLSGASTHMVYPRVIIDVDPGCSATIVEHHVGDSAALSNSHTDIALARDARLEHYRVFETGADATHFDSLDVHQDQDSYCKQFSIVLGGGLVRTTLEGHLNQRGASLDSYSLLAGHANRHLDCVNIVTHGAPHTRSRQTARAIASDFSRVIFNSKVIVQAGAVNSDSQQSCRGLLLSASAEIDTRPQLEIHTDEVKCAHGATTGRLDPDMLFYMLSRGLDRETAQSLLVYAFLADVLTGMSVIAARAAIENILIGLLPDSQTLRKFR